NTIGIAGRNRNGNFSERRIGQSMAGDALPCITAIIGDEDTAPGAAALASPGLDIDLPRAGKERIRIFGVHGDLGGAGVFIDEEDALPSLAAIFSAEDATLGLRSIAGAEGLHKDDVRILRIDYT